MFRSGSEGLLVMAEPLEWAEEVCRRMVKVVRTRGDALLLDADPAWAWAINKVLVSKGVRVNELARSSPYGHEPPSRN
jgi:hypothetical protein